MTAVAAEVASSASSPSPGRFEVGYVTDHGTGCCVALAEALALPFEHLRPGRRFAARKGQRHLSGLWWSATTGGHVGFESWLERDHLMLLDFDSQVAGISSQPFWLRWAGEHGQLVSHVPDYFARRLDGSAVVVDCRPAERRGPADAAKFDATAEACALVGWEQRLEGATDEVVAANVRWMAGYRHPRHRQVAAVAALRRVFAVPAPLMAGAGSAGDPIAVLPVLFHLLWRHELAADLSVPLGPFTLVSAGAAG